MSLEILLPFYGRFDHFRLAVESVLAQTDADWRMTVVDDVYPDLAPGEWLQSLGDSRIRYIRNDVNLGVGKNFAKCVTLMTEEHAVIFGCDDVMMPGYVGRVRQLLEANADASVIQPGVEVIDSDGVVVLPLGDRVKRVYQHRDTRDSAVLVAEDMAASLLRGNWTYFPSLVWRTELLRRFRFDTDREVVPDLVMLLDIAADGGKLVVDEEIVFRYRRHSGSVSSWRATDGSRFTEERELFESSAARFSALGWSRATRAARRHVSSRLNALSQVPLALANRNGRAVASLVRHALR
ncbi:glycosyltransferase involved in cell wall biosynthesis [Conyzicola nivalis]|uniref:Glycosyltransferase involved in cell wall biosynthesis n=1 Tax=Conyzicola nivalis TaxID=1477021 RepID=A0ABV2QR07_9MICO